MQGVLTYCANGRTTVPMYAYAARLLVFGVSLTSVTLSKIIFLTDCKRAAMPLFLSCNFDRKAL